MNIKILLVAALTLLMNHSAQCQGFLRANEKQIVDVTGQPIILRGMGLGGWMLQEGYMLQINNQGTQHSIKNKITELIGKENCDKFYDLWLQNHTTRSDVDSLAKWGFNSIRLPMHYNLFTLPIEDEPVKGENTWLTRGFEMVDNLVAWCKANNMYLILDLHAAPGGQGKDVNISDYDETKPSLWESDLNKKKTIALWRKLAERYANEPVIGSYDMINEPNWTFEGKNKNGTEDTQNQPIWQLYEQITNAIREVDRNHIIIIEGNGWGNNYRGMARPWDANMVMSFHKYWNPNEQKEISYILDYREKLNVPVWLGETGENDERWFTDAIALLEKNQIGSAWWPLKKINSVVCPLMIVAPPEYKQITDYWNNKGEKPSGELANEVLFKIAANLKAENCRYNKDVIDAMFRQTRETATIPYMKHTLPVRIYASDYDMGKLGIAYNDRDDKNTNSRYRNDGVDIVESTDQTSMTNGFQVTSIENGEWMQYSIDVPKTGTYTISARVASANSGGKLKILFYRQIPVTNESPADASTQQFTLPDTGSDNNFQSVPLQDVKLTKGPYFMRILAEKGGFGLGWVEIATR